MPIHFLHFFQLFSFGVVLGLRLGTQSQKETLPEYVAAGSEFNGPLCTNIQEGEKEWECLPFAKLDFDCSKRSKLPIVGEQEDGPGDKKYLCMDGWEAIQMTHKGKPCVAYDLGVRSDATFALTALKHFGCVVRAYDPSPHTSEWWDTSKGTDVLELKEAERDGSYKLYKQAASETDGPYQLFAYNWDQLGAWQANEGTRQFQKEYVVPGKSYAGMLEDNADTYIDVMKIDIEGSEFAFFKGMFHQGCPKVLPEHLILEWHSLNMDMKLGAPPEVKEVEDKMTKCGFRKYWSKAFNHKGEDPTSEEQFKINTTYYGHSQYCRSC